MIAARRKLRSILALALAGAILPTLIAAATPLPTQAPQKHFGVASCANSLCHGAVIPHIGSNIAHTEYTVWTRRDPHAQTWNALLRDDYRAITDKLGLERPDLERKCLGCHASDVAPKFRGPKFALEDGIGCETCHGGAERYLATHTAEDATRARNIEHGLYPTDDMVLRTRLCLSCHYGTPDRFVTHDIMGAGHPRISFEMDTFTELLPAHVIYDDDYARRKPVYSHVKMWALGQAVAAESMLAMLASRHLRANGLFPELSLFDCHSCHHPMSQKTWRAGSVSGLGPGMVPLNDSSLLMLGLVLRQIAPRLGEQLTTQLGALHAASNTSVAATKQSVARLQQTVARAIDTIVRHQFAPAQIVGITSNLLDAGIAGEYQDYIAAEQGVMAIGALTAAWNDVAPFDRKTARLIGEMMNTLYDSVANDESFRPREFEAALRKIRTGLLR